VDVTVTGLGAAAKTLGAITLEIANSNTKIRAALRFFANLVPLRYSTVSITIRIRPSMGNRKQQILLSSAHVSLKLITKVEVLLSESAQICRQDSPLSVKNSR
jgi:hypothetical protein